MSKKERIVRYSAEQIARKIARGEDRTDWKRARSMTDAEVDRLADAEEGALARGWEAEVVLGLPAAKKDIHIRLDADVLAWFKATGRGYQTRINRVLRAYVDSRKRAVGR